jgi:transcriptional regulator with XRE-family HTH domain
MEIDRYIELAHARQAVPSDRQLAKLLNVNPSLLSMYRTRRAWPSDETMVRLAELSGIAPDVALLDLNRWRAGDRARPIYEKLLARIAVVICLLITASVFLVSSPAVAGTSEHLALNNPATIYYGTSWRRRIARFLKNLLWLFSSRTQQPA